MTRIVRGYSCCLPEDESCWIVVCLYVNLREKNPNKNKNKIKQKKPPVLHPKKHPKANTTKVEPTLRIKRNLTSYGLSGDMGYLTPTETKAEARSS